MAKTIQAPEDLRQRVHLVVVEEAWGFGEDGRHPRGRSSKPGLQAGKLPRSDVTSKRAARHLHGAVQLCRSPCATMGSSPSQHNFIASSLLSLSSLALSLSLSLSPCVSLFLCFSGHDCSDLKRNTERAQATWQRQNKEERQVKGGIPNPAALR